MAQNLVPKIKLALRINHNSLDDDIADTILTARTEMIRAGVPFDVAQSDNEVVVMAIRTYCVYTYQDQGLFESWQYQLDNLRKSTM